MRESGFRPRAWNKSAAEKHYALQVAKRNEDRLDALGYSPYQWGFGSKGLFQILGPIAVLRSTGPRFPTAFIEEMGGPDLEFRPGVAIATAFDLARGLTHWDNFLGTWGSLNAGWGLPARMHDPKRIEKKGKQAEARAEKLGWAPGWIHEPISPIPAWATPDELAEFARAAQWAYDNCEVK